MRVKVIVDLKGDFPKPVQMQIENQSTGEIRTNLIAINYDCVPKYCLQCKMSGHKKEECRGTNRAKHKAMNKKQVMEEVRDLPQPTPN